MTTLAVLYAALAFDLYVGEPPNALHPVAWLGRIANAPIRWSMRLGAAAQFASGTLIVSGCAAVFVWLGTLVINAAEHWVTHVIVSALVLKIAFALRALGTAAEHVRAALIKQRGRAARVALSSLCSRDPHTLSDDEVTAATIESVAENLSDSFVAPLLYYTFFGIAGALAYRAINTLDAMVGYRGQYEWLGKPAAWLDDLLNFLPARLTAFALIATTHHRQRTYAIWRRDRGNTPSPNAGHPMAAMAGLLGMRLTKPGAYALGDAIHPLHPNAIAHAWHAAVRAAVLVVALLIVALTAVLP